MRWRRWVLGAAVLTVLLGACGGGSSSSNATSPPSPSPSARPSSPARISILSPKNGEVFNGSTVPVKLRLEGAKIVKPTTTHITPTKGHLHLLLDDKIVSMNYGLDETLHSVKPGQHVLRVEFVASDHLPFDPRVFAQVVFEVKS